MTHEQSGLIERINIDGMISEKNSPPSSNDNDVLRETRKTLLSRIMELCSIYGWVINGKEQVASVSKNLLSHICERQIKFLLANRQAETEKSFDPVFSVRSEFVKRHIIQRLITRIASAGYSVIIQTEVKSPFGIYDVVVVQDGKGSDLARVEIKAARGGLNFEQIERYLWEPSSPLILVRAVMGQVTRIVTDTDFVMFSLSESLAKVDRLLDRSSDIAIPGPYCRWCPHSACNYNQRRDNRSSSSSQLIRQSDRDFAIDIGLLFSNMHFICDRTAELVLEEMSRTQGK